MIARSSAVDTASADLREDLANLWKKLAALKVTSGTGTMRG